MTSAGNKIRTRPLMRRALWDFYLALMNEMTNRDEQNVFPIFQSKLSTFFDPDKYKGRPQRGFILRESADLFLATKPPNALPIAAFDILDRPMQPGEVDVIEQKRAFFREHQIPYISIDPSKLLGALRNDTIQNINALLDSSAMDTPVFQRQAINPKQLDMISASAVLTAEHGFYCVHEPSLDSLFDVPEDWMRDLCRQDTLSFASINFPRHTTVDAVIASKPPNASPLVGVEFDGAVHEKPEQQVRDRLKDKIFLAAGVPLIRISSADLHGNGAWSAKAAIIARKEFLGVLGKDAAKNMHDSWWRVDRLHEHLLEEAEAIQASNPTVAANIEQYAREIHRLAEGRHEKLQVAQESNTELSQKLIQSWAWADEDRPERVLYNEWSYGAYSMEEIEFDPKRWPITKGLKFDYQPHFSPTENDGVSVYVDLKIEPEVILISGGYSESLSYQSERLRFRVVCKPEDEERYRSIASGFLTNRLLRDKAIPILETRRQMLFDAYRRGLHCMRF